MRTVFVVAAAMALVTCVGVTDERARRDEDVGKATAGGASVEVIDGLASVRGLENGSLWLWAQAPSLRIRVRPSPGASTSWTLTIDNTLPDAMLDGGGALSITPIDAARPTQKRWRFDLRSDVETTLILRSPSEPSDRWRFAVLSDIQEAIDRVQDIYRRMNADPSIRFVASAGDLTTRGTPEQLDRFQRELESLAVPFFTTLGNHELGQDDGAPYQRYFGRGTFRFVFGGAQLTFVDSASATLDPRVYAWLRGWLDEAGARPHVVFMHIPPIDPIGVRNGSFAERNEAAKLLAELAGGGVDLTIYGHIHSYYAFANAGIPAYISGGGGAIPERFDGIGRHYLMVDVDPKSGELETGLVRIDQD
jgi:predicted phosphodiesterase